jgi:4-hydroxy-3-methylbut-2-enyl diphosphate reductase
MMNVENRFCQVSGVKVHLRQGGQGRPILFLHGAGGVMGWTPFFQQLATGAQVWAPDHPGFGLSDVPEDHSMGPRRKSVLAFMDALGIQHLAVHPSDADLKNLKADDVVIVPAFGAEVSVIDTVKALGCQIVDTTCGDVMSVWKRVRQNATERVTSIIHGKASHEETRATASRALGADGLGHFVIVLDLKEAQQVADFMMNGGDPAEFLAAFRGAVSPGFDPLQHLQRIGVANQTTMLRSETEAIQNLLREAVAKRDRGNTANFRYFDTICGATQDRQDALFQLLNESLDMLMVVGGYNSSNTTHLAEIGSEKLPTWFIRNADCLTSPNEIRHFDLHAKKEIVSKDWLPDRAKLSVGITAGASCPNSLIEDTLRRLLELREESER